MKSYRVGQLGSGKMLGWVMGLGYIATGCQYNTNNRYTRI